MVQERPLYSDFEISQEKRGNKTETIDRISWRLKVFSRSKMNLVAASNGQRKNRDYFYGFRADKRKSQPWRYSPQSALVAAFIYCALV